MSAATPAPATLSELVRELADRHGDREALVQGERRIDYAGLERASAELALGLVAGGAGKGTRIALLMPNGPDCVIAWLAAARIGALVIPLSTFYPARELHWVLRHADVHTLLCRDRYLNHDYLERLEKLAPSLSGSARPPLYLSELPYLCSVWVWGEGERSWTRPGPGGLAELGRATPGVDEELLRELEDCVTPADPTVIIYTSGSTAEPKGAVHTHGAILRHTRMVNESLPCGPEDVCFFPAPFFWVGGFQRQLHSLYGGARTLYLESFDAAGAIELIEREGPTVLMVWPHQAKAIREHPRFADLDLSRLRSGPLDFLPEGRRPSAPDRVPNIIGMTETFAHHTIEAAGTELPPEKRGACGRALPGLERRIVDPQSGRPAAPGELGELWVRGFNLMQGLYKREREQVFTPDGFYRTGDRGAIDADGYYFFHGRLGDMIKTGGANVSPREVEGVLLSLDEIEQACVVGVEDPEMGQIVVAAAVPSAGSPPDESELRARLREQLSAFKVPRRFFWLASGDLPLTDSGKLHPGRLRELVQRLVAAEDANGLREG